MKLASLYVHHNPLPKIAQKVFESFADRFEYNFYLGMLSRRFDVIYLAVLDGRGPIKIAVEAGATISPHSTALGKLLLAHLDDEQLLAFLNQSPLEAFTSRTITNKERFRKEISEIRRVQYAVNDGEHYENVAAVAVPVFNEAAEVKMSVSLGYPRQLVVDKRLQVAPLVSLAREVAQQIALRSAGLPRQKTITRERSR
jgi:DNA-binding IclR family transcriptional regulator